MIEPGRCRIERYFAGSIVAFAILLALFSVSTFAQEATTPNTDIVLSIHADGSLPFSGVDAAMAHDAGCLDSTHPIAHTPGDDGDGDGVNSTCPAAANGILRTFDTVTYRVDWNVNEVDATGVTTTFTLPALIPEAQWTAIPDGCDSVLSAITNNDQTLTCVIGDHEQGTFGTVFPIAKINGTNSLIDGSVLSLSGEISSNEGVTGTSNQVDLTLSAAARYDWRKGKAYMYRDVVKTGTGGDPDVNGYVIVWPIMLKPSGGGSRGLAPLNDAVPIQFFDHFFFMSSNTDAVLDADLLTAANLGDYTNYPFGRVCGGYDGAGDEEFWDYGDQGFKIESLPYGVAGLGNADNTTLGAQGAESISCSDVTTGNYPIAQIDITGHNTSNAAPKSVTGSGSNGAVITGQVAFWVAETEIYPGTIGNSLSHNIISGTTTELDPADPIDEPTEQGDPIVVAGSSTGFETNATNNGPHTSLLKTEAEPGPSAYRHWVMMHRGPYKEMRLFDPNHGLPFASIDTRRIDGGGLGQNGLYEYDGSISIALGTDDIPWGFDGEVSRNQVVTVEMKLGTFHATDYASADRNQIHGCLYIDNEYMNIVDFPTNFDIAETSTMYEFRTDATIGSLGTGNSSHGLVHVLYGDHARSYTRSWALSEPVRLNPAFTPNYVVEVAKAATDVGIDYERGDVRCDDVHADGGWTAIDSSTDLSAFDTDGQPGYEGIEMIRLRTIDPVPWNAPFPSVWNNHNDAGSTANTYFGTNFNLYVQAQVKSAVADAPTGQRIYVHAARARGEYDGTAPPPIDDCTRSGGADFATYNTPTAGWCNLATLPEVGQPGQSDPIEHTSSTQNYNTVSHRDTVTIVGPKLGFSKKNADGATDIVQNGDLVTFNMGVSVTGSPTPTDMVRDISVVDTLIANYEYVSHVDPTDGSCAIAGQTLTCNFGDRIAPWSNTFSVTVRVKDAGPEAALVNTATASGVYGSDDFPVSSTGVAYAYTPGPYHQVKINKEVPDLEGPCVHAPGEPYYGPDSGDCSWTDRDDTLGYVLEYANTGFKDMENFRLIDLLPHVDDEAEAQTVHQSSPAGAPGLFGDGRWPNTDFAGTMELVSVTPTDAGATVYYTKRPAVDVNRDPDDPSNLTSFPNGATVWCTAFSGGACPASIAEATAFYVDIGTLAIADTGKVEIMLQTADNVEDDIYTNTFGARTDDILVPGRSNDVSIMIEEYDLALIKRLKAGQSAGVINGSQVIFEIVAKNQGTVDSDEYSITDQIPAGMSFVSANPVADAAPVAGLLTWTFSDPNTLAPGATQIIELTLEVDDISQAGFRNWAEIESDSHDDSDSTPGSNDGSDPGNGVGPVGNDDITNHNDIDNDATTQDPNDEDDSDYESLFAAEYDLALIKRITAVAPTPVVVGSQVTFAIDVMNQGNVGSGAYAVADAIPPGMSFVSASPVATVDPGVGSTGTVEWLVGSGAELAPGAMTTFTVTVQVDDIAQGPFRNAADITDDSSGPYGGDRDSVAGDGSGATDTVDDSDVTNDNDPGDQDDSDFALLPVGGYDLALIKTIKLVDPLPAALGSQVTFEITVMNQGGVPSGSYTVADALPAGMGYVSSSPAATTDPGAGISGAVEWVVGVGDELVPGASTTFEVVVEIIDDTLGPYRNGAEITADSGDDEDSDPTDGSGATDTFDDDDVTNDNDPGDSDDSDFEELSLVPEYDLSLIKQTVTVAPTPVANGTQVTYRMTVMNQGNVNSGTFTVTDSIPAGMNFVSAVPTATTDPGVGSTGPVTWVVAANNELEPGAITTFDLVVEIADDGQSPFRNEAEITADSGAPYGGDSDSDPTDGSGATDTFNDDDVSNDADPDDSDDSDFEELTAGGYDLALIKEFVSMAPLPAGLGTQIVFDITVMNQGGIPSGPFTFSDVLPSPLGYVQAVPAPTVQPGVGNNGTVEWSMSGVNELAPGQQVTVRVTTEVIDISLGGQFRNEAEITADSGDDEDSDPTDGSGATDTFDDNDVTNDEDPGDSDDSDWTPFELPSVYDLSIDKALDPNQPLWVVQGQTVNFDVTVSNEGNLPSNAFSIVDTMPAGLSFASASGPGFVCTPDTPAAGQVQCDYTPPTATDLAPLQNVQIDLAMTVDDLSQAPFVNHVEITDDSADDYGLVDNDSTPGSNGAAGDTGPGEGTPGETEDDASSTILRAASSTPITLKVFRSELSGNQLTVDWLTSMEDANQGFRLYGRAGDGEWKPVTKAMIPTQAVDDDGTAYRVELAASPRLTELTLTDVDLFGSEVVHGPFEIGRRYGDFDATGNHSSRRIGAIEYAPDEPERFLGFVKDEIYLEVDKGGIHRVSYEALKRLGVDFKGTPAKLLALTHRGQPVPIRVRTRPSTRPVAGLRHTPARSVFGEGAWIEFIAQPIDSLYTDTNVYRLSVDESLARRIAVESGTRVSTPVRRSAMSVHEWAPDRQYSRVAPGDDPWYALKLSAINVPLSKTLKLALTDVEPDSAGTLEIDLWAVADNPRINGDHHIRVKVNGQVVGRKVFDGVSETTLRAILPAGVLVPGINTVTLVLPLNRGTNVDTIVVDAIRIGHQRRLLPGSGQLMVDADGAGGYRTGGFTDRNVTVYRQTDDGKTTRVRARMRKSKSGFRVLFGRRGDRARYYVTDSRSRLTPSLRRVPAIAAQHGSEAQYLVIAHRRFMTADLTRLVQARQAEGLTTRVVDVDSVYAQYSGGIVDPQAIRQYIADAHEDLGTRTVLLVGGDSYDYKRNLIRRAQSRGDYAKSWIPSLYASTGQAVQHAPVDPLYGDVDDDGLPEVAIGRLPVQTHRDLRRMVDKTLNYAVTVTDHRAVFVSDRKDDGTRRSFARMSRAVRSRLSGWGVNSLARESLNVRQIRNRFKNLVDDGRALTVYFGHSDANAWGFDGLVRRSDVRSLSNVASPTAVIQFGCWNTYYVAPRANTLAHQWLVEGDHGAAIVMGATTLTEAGSEQDFASYIMDGISTGLSYGEAVMNAKNAMIASYGLESVKDLIGGFVILGDPAMKPPRE